VSGPPGQDGRLTLDPEDIRLNLDGLERLRDR
jgi:hypothetical protein